MMQANIRYQIKRIHRIATIMQIAVMFIFLPLACGVCVYFLDPSSDWQLFLYSVVLVCGIGMSGVACARIDLWAEDRIRQAELLDKVDSLDGILSGDR